MDIISLIVGLIVGAVALFLVMYYKNKGTIASAASLIDELKSQQKSTGEELARQRNEFQSIATQFAAIESKALLLEQDKQEIKQELDTKRLQNDQLGSELAAAEQNLNNLNQKLKEQRVETEKIQEKFTKEFENLANRILDEKSAKFSEQNKEQMKNVLAPFQEKLGDFKKKVEDTYEKGLKERSELAERIKGLSVLNKQMLEDANNLANALKGDSKIQGNWGELILSRLLERSGLKQGIEYSTQSSFTDEFGKRLQPDVTINLPEGKTIIIDSKVSLTAYEQAVNAEDKESEEASLKAHLLSVKTHIKTLSEKHYQKIDAIQSLDFVILFIPIEPAFAAAVNQELDLFNFAFDKRIVLATPSTLLAMLKTIESVWKNEYRSKNVEEIATQAGALYDKFVGFVESMQKIQNRLNQTQVEYDDAMKKLKTGNGNLIRRAEKIKKLGVSSSKQLPKDLLEEE